MNLPAVLASVRLLQEAKPKRRPKAKAKPVPPPFVQPLPASLAQPQEPVVPEVSEDPDETDVLAGYFADPKEVAMSVDPIGHERLEALKKLDMVEFSSRGDYYIRYTGGNDFVDKSNKKFLQERFKWLYTVNGGMGFDLDDIMSLRIGRAIHYTDRFSDEDMEAAFVDYLGQIPDDEWDDFVEQIDGLDNYPCLDEDGMSELEMEAQTEYIEDDGTKDFVKALAKQPLAQDSFIQFFIEHIRPKDVWHYLRVQDNWEFSMDEGSAWMNMDRFASQLTLEEILGEDVGYAMNDAGLEAKVARLRVRFEALKRVAFRLRIEQPLRAAVTRYLLADGESGHLLVSLFDKLSRDQLFQLVDRLVPNSAFADDDELAWRPEVVKRPEAGFERQPQAWGNTSATHRTIWTITSETVDNQTPARRSEDVGIEVLALSVIPKIEGWHKKVTGDHPDQLQFQLESAARIVGRLLEDNVSDDFDPKDDLLAAMPEQVVYNDQGHTISEITGYSAVEVLATPRDLGAICDNSPEKFARLLHGMAIFRFQRAISPGEDVLVLVPRTDDDGTEITGFELGKRYNYITFNELKSRWGFAVDLLGRIMADQLMAGDPDHVLYLLMTYWGAKALLPYRKFLRKSKSQTLVMAAGIAYGMEGRISAAARRLNSAASKVDKSGLWVFVRDFPDLVEVFEKSCQRGAKQVFEHDNYDWFTDQGTTLSANDLVQHLNSEHTKMVLASMHGTVYENDEGEEIVFDKEAPQETLRWLLEYDAFTEVRDAVDYAVQDAYRTAQIDRSFEVWCGAAMDAIGADEHKFFDDPTKPGGDRLGLHIPWKNLEVALNKAVEEGNTDFNYQANELAQFVIDNRVEDASIDDREDYFGNIDDAILTENLAERLPEPPGPQAQPEDPNQLNLPLPESLIQERVYGKSCTMIGVPPEQADAIQTWAKSAIPEDRLYRSEKEDGYEDDPHITVLWGLLEPTPSDELRSIIERTRVFPVKLGKVSLFRNDDFDVVKLDVESPWLRQLNARIKSAVPNKQTYPDYNPHVTLAYVLKGSCDDLEGKEVFSGDPAESTFYADHVEFTGAGDDDAPENRHIESIPLNKVGEVGEGQAVDPFGGLSFPADSGRMKARNRKRSRKRTIL